MVLQGESAADFVCVTFQKHSGFGAPSLTAVFVHLSDIHFGQEKYGGEVAINTDARDQLIEDAAVVMKSIGKGLAGIIVTGDIAYSATAKQYAEAGEWLDRLAVKLGASIYEIQMVPGNHDVDRSEISSAVTYMLNDVATRGEPALDAILDDEGDRDHLYRRFHAYRDFAGGYRCPLDFKGENSTDFRVTLAPNRALRFVRLNSALACSKKDDKGKLILGARQRRIPVRVGEETVVLSHHPLSWFQDSEDAKRYLRGRGRVFISGHEHFPSLEIDRVENGSDLMLLAAGATTPDEVSEQYTYRYNIVEFGWDEQQDALAVTIHARTWRDDFKRFEEDRGFLAGRSATTFLGSPNFRAAPREAATHQGEVVDSPVPPEIETVPNAPNEGGDPVVTPSADEKLFLLRFFRDLTEGERLQTLVALNAVPEDLAVALDHDMQRRMFSNVFKLGRGDDLKRMVTDVLKNRERKSI